MKRNLKRFMCLVLAVVMVLGTLPATAFANSGVDGAGGTQFGADSKDIYFDTTDYAFLHVTLVDLPLGSATPVSQMKVVGEMILYNGLPTGMSMQNVRMLGNNAIDYLKGGSNINTTPKSMQALGSDMPVVNYLEKEPYKTAYANYSKTWHNNNRGLEFWRGTAEGIQKSWQGVETLSAFLKEIAPTEWGPNPFLDEVLKALFTQDGKTQDDANAAWGELSPEQRTKFTVDGRELRWAAMFMADAEADANTKPIVGSTISRTPATSSIDPAAQLASGASKIARYRLIVEPGIIGKKIKGSASSGLGQVAGYTLRESITIANGSANNGSYPIHSSCVIAGTTAQKNLASSFQLVRNEWYDKVMGETNNAHTATFSFANDGAGGYTPSFKKPSASLNNNSAGRNAAANGEGYGISILSPYTFGVPTPQNPGGGTTFVIEKAVDGVGVRGTKDGEYAVTNSMEDRAIPIYGVVDARRFVDSVLSELPDGVSFESLSISTQSIGGGKVVISFANNATKDGTVAGTYADTSNILLDPSLSAAKKDKLPDSFYDVFYFAGYVYGGAKILANVEWKFEIEPGAGVSSAEVDAIAEDHVSEIVMMFREESAHKYERKDHVNGDGFDWVDLMTANGMYAILTYFDVETNLSMWTQWDQLVAYLHSLHDSGALEDYGGLWNAAADHRSSCSVTVESETPNAIVGVYYDSENQWTKAYKESGCFRESIETLADSVFPLGKRNPDSVQTIYNPISADFAGAGAANDDIIGEGTPVVIVRAIDGDTDAHVLIRNNTGFRFSKMTEDPDDDTEYSFKVTSIKYGDGSELPWNYVVYYEKDVQLNANQTAVGIKYGELKDEILSAGNGHGYRFLVPVGYSVTVQEVDESGNPADVECHGYKIRGLESDQLTWEEMPLDDMSLTMDKDHADVLFFNGELDGGCHVIIDYNLNGIAATSFHGTDSCIVVSGTRNPIECGTMTAGQTAHAKLNGITQEMVLYDDAESGAKLVAKFKGIFTEPTGGMQLAGPEAINGPGCSAHGEIGFDYMVPPATPDDHLIVLYAQWDFEYIPGDTDKMEAELDGELFWVVFDHNYTGGTTIEIAVGEVELKVGEGEEEEEDPPFVPCECGCTDETSATGIACTGGEFCTCCDGGTPCCAACTCGTAAGGGGGGAGGGEDPGGEGGEGEGGGSMKMGFYDPYAHIADNLDERNSMRTGWLFCGWSHDVDTVVPPCGLPSDQNELTDTSYRGFDEGYMPEESATYYGIWYANDIVWNANGGAFADGSGEHTQPGRIYMAAERVPADVEVPVRTGYHFNGWYWDEECMDPIQEFESGVQPGQTYYAGWTADPVYVYYYDVRENTALIGKQEYEYGDTFSIMVTGRH